MRTGWVEPPDLAALLAGATVLAYPSLYEGFGFPPLQAMRAGVPVVATRAGSLPEVLGDGALLVDPGDHDGLVAALDACLGDEALRARLVAAGTAWSARLLVGALRRGARGALPRRRGRRRWLSARASVLLAVEQLRRRVPGGIGVYARGLLGGLAQCAAEGDASSHAAGQPGPGRPGRRTTRWPVRPAGAGVAAAGPAPDAGLGPRRRATRPRASTSCTRCRWPRPRCGGPAAAGSS